MFQRLLTGFAFIAFVGSAMAQNTPVGKWQSIDDKTKEAKAEITITESGGVLTGKITKRLLKDAKPDDVCDECKDARKGQPIVGLEIIRGAKKEASEEEYTLKLTPAEGGKKLNVRGSIGPFGRTQTWNRVE
jgi:uncharacterized protein (DUF2147 family)